MAEINAAVQIVVKQKYLSFDVQNVFYYRATNALSAFPSLSAIAADIQANLLPAINGCQSTRVTNQSLVLTKFNTNGETLAWPISGGGALTPTSGDTMPPFVAIGIKLGGADGSTRSGAKRIGGLRDQDAIDGTLSGAVINAALTTLSSQILRSLTASTEFLVPIIVKRIAEGLLPPFTYRLPATLLESDYNDIVEAVVQPQVTSQVTRKFTSGN